MRKILVAYDGSASAQRSLEFLIQLAEDIPQLEVHVVNVQLTPLPYGDHLGPLRQAAKRHAREHTTQAAQLLARHGIQAITHECLGDPVEEISKTLSILKCDSLVMGTRGMNTLANWVMGSVASRVLHEVTVPVILIK